MSKTAEEIKNKIANENNFDSFESAIRYTFNRQLLQSEKEFIDKLFNESMEEYAKLKISESVTNIVNNCDKEPTEPITSDIIKRWDCVIDGMYEDPKGYWIYLEDHERVTTELEKEIESYKSLLDDGVSEVRRLEKENQELREQIKENQIYLSNIQNLDSVEERNILFTLYTNNNKLLTKKL